MSIAEALREAGITAYDVRVAPRPGTWVPMGVLWHHVGNSPPRALQLPPPSLHLVQQGRADLAGPLCQWLVDGEGNWWWITDGRANHAGAGDIDVWHWLIADSATREPDPPRPDDNIDTSDGNGHLVGIEVEGNGNWSQRVYDSMVTGTRVLNTFYKRPLTNLIGHKEWTSRKVDPAGISMHDARLRVAGTIPTPPPLPPTPEPEEEDMDYIAIPVDEEGNLHWQSDGTYLDVPHKKGDPVGPQMFLASDTWMPLFPAEPEALAKDGFKAKQLHPFSLMAELGARKELKR